MATTTSEVDDIRRGMAQIRQRLHQDMQGVVAGAEAAADWKHYVRLYPWAAAGAAFVVGYLIVPHRRRSTTKTAEKAAEAVVAKLTEVADKAPAKAETAVETKKSKGWMGTLIGLVSPLLINAAKNYALGYAESFIAQKTQAASQSGPGAGPPGGETSAPRPSAPR